MTSPPVTDTTATRTPLGESSESATLAPTGSLCPNQNVLLAACPNRLHAGLWPHFNQIEVKYGQVLHTPTGSQPYVWFPVTAQISLNSLLEDGSCAEFASVGSDGMVGIEALFGNHKPPGVAMVIADGIAWRVPCTAVRQAFEQDAAWREVLLRYAQGLIVQIGQTAVCNRHHTVEQQFFRILLSGLDRAPGCEIRITHEGLSHRLGFRRETISEVASKARLAGLIDYRRGRIAVLDRARMERLTCECYRLMRQEVTIPPQPRPATPWCGASQCQHCRGPTSGC